MGNIHKVLDKDFFNNSKYIEIVKKQMCCDNFRKEYPKEFEIMFDIFEKFIELYNCFFADSNGENIYRIKKAKKLLAQFFKMKYNEKEKYHVSIGIKYSTRDIANLPEKEVKSIYRLMEKCYYAIYYIEENEKENGTVRNVKKLIKEKMKKLEKVGFDKWVKGNISFDKNKSSNYKIFICAFDTLNKDNEDYIEEFKKGFNFDFDKDFGENEFDEVFFIYTLVAKANNGIVNALANTQDKQNALNSNSSPQEIYKTYLDTLHLNIKDSYSNLSTLHFSLTASITYESIRETYNISFNEMISNFDLYFFLDKMKNCVNTNEITIHSNATDSIIKKLQDIYNTITNKQDTDIKETYKEAFKKVQEIIKRNAKYYIRVS